MHHSSRRPGLLFMLAVLVTAAGFTTAAEAKTRVLTLMVKQDFSDCTNSTVPPTPAPASVGGEAMVTLRANGFTTVNVRLTKVAPNTTYHLFLKCVTLLGDIKTNAAGRGNNTFQFQTSSIGKVYAFDMYPDGAPLGNKYQSIQINFQ
ncbi:MAG: hypothetical protein JWQ17_2940 [Tardiphaga sp.]|jgi:hypothetical protein|nr:hypothetical protein [Tardiphaga sp.]